MLTLPASNRCSINGQKNQCRTCLARLLLKAKKFMKCFIIYKVVQMGLLLLSIKIKRDKRNRSYSLPTQSSSLSKFPKHHYSLHLLVRIQLFKVHWELNLWPCKKNRRKHHSVYTKLNFKLEVEGTCLSSPSAQKLNARRPTWGCSFAGDLWVSRESRLPLAPTTVPRLGGDPVPRSRGWSTCWRGGGGARFEARPGASWET